MSINKIHSFCFRANTLLRSFPHMLILLFAFSGCGGLGGGPGSGSPMGENNYCGNVERLVPDYTENNPSGPEFREYQTNATQYDAICLPEAWHFMQDKWQGLRNNIPNWPTIVVIDDGFFPTADSSINPMMRPGYPDGSGTHPQGSAWGHIPQPGRMVEYGHHGTAVLSLLASESNNAFLISGVVGPWPNIANGNQWGANFLPVRIGNGGVLSGDISSLIQIFNEVVNSLNEIRIANISKSLIDVDFPNGDSTGDRLKNQINIANSRQVVVVTGAGNKLGTVAADRWLRQFENVIVVGGLNSDGTDLWIDDQTTGTATGPGIDIFAPAQNFTIIGSSLTGHETIRDTQIDSGTSYAAPLVSGVAAMMLNVNPTLDPWEVRDILIKTADLVPLSNSSINVPRLNAYKALLCTSSVQRSSTLSPPSGGQPVKHWSCDMGSLGTASGMRVGF